MGTNYPDLAIFTQNIYSQISCQDGELKTDPCLILEVISDLTISLKIFKIVVNLLRSSQVILDPLLPSYFLLPVKWRLKLSLKLLYSLVTIRVAI